MELSFVLIIVQKDLFVSEESDLMFFALVVDEEVPSDSDIK